jgi:DNA-binding transcriptional MerR regulator
MPKITTGKITIGDVAARIRLPDEDLLVVRDRLRAWVREGIIKPERDPKVRGAHRYYGESAIVRAAVLSHLSRHYGLSYASKQPMSKMLHYAVQEAEKVSALAGSEGPERFLVLWTEGREVKNPSCEIQTIDVKSKSPRSIKISSEANDAIVVNLSRLFERIGVPLTDIEQLEHHEKEVERLQKKYPGYGRAKRG